MSAFWVTCPDCGGRYISGMVGSTPWPPHECPVRPSANDSGPDREASRVLGEE